jgi:hypothetical protein
MLGAMKWIFSQFLSATVEPAVDRVSAPRTTPSWKGEGRGEGWVGGCANEKKKRAGRDRFFVFVFREGERGCGRRYPLGRPFRSLSSTGLT